MQIVTEHLSRVAAMAEADISDPTALAVLTKSIAKLLTRLKKEDESESVNRYAQQGLDPRVACRSPLVNLTPVGVNDMTYPAAIRALEDAGWIAGLPMGKVVMYRFSVGEPIARS